MVTVRCQIGRVRKQLEAAKEALSVAWFYAETNRLEEEIADWQDVLGKLIARIAKQQENGK